MVYFSNNYFALAPTRDPYGDGILLETLDGNRIQLSMENLFSSQWDGSSEIPVGKEEMSCSTYLSVEEATELGWRLIDAAYEIKNRRTLPHIEERQRQRVKEGKCSSDY